MSVVAHGFTEQEGPLSGNQGVAFGSLRLLSAASRRQPEPPRLAKLVKLEGTPRPSSALLFLTVASLICLQSTRDGLGAVNSGPATLTRRMSPRRSGLGRHHAGHLVRDAATT
jgi:hypothetical protein